MCAYMHGRHVGACMHDRHVGARVLFCPLIFCCLFLPCVLNSVLCHIDPTIVRVGDVNEIGSAVAEAAAQDGNILRILLNSKLLQCVHKLKLD